MKSTSLFKTVRDGNGQFFIIAYCSLFLVPIILLWVTLSTAGEFQWQLSGEGGPFFVDTALGARANGSLWRCQSVLAYDVTQSWQNAANQTQANLWAVQALIQPEFHDLNLTQFNAKIQAKGQLRARRPPNEWQLLALTRRNFYQLTNETLAYDIFQIQAGWARLLSPNFMTQINADLIYRDLSNHPHVTHDIFCGRGQVGYRLSRYANIGFGAYGERFVIRQRRYQLSLNEPTENLGWRLGLELSGNYQRRTTVSLSYRLLRNDATILVQPAWEHTIRIVFSRMMTSRWMIFLLVDDSWRQTKHEPNAPISLMYSSLENENDIHLKLERTLKPALGLYAKVGYSSDDLAYHEDRQAGWSMLVGLTYRVEK